MGLKRARVLRAPDARKGCHIGTGVLFCMCWRMFPAGPAARFWAAAIPGAITVQVLAVGLGLWGGEGGGGLRPRHPADSSQLPLTHSLPHPAHPHQIPSISLCSARAEVWTRPTQRIPPPPHTHTQTPPARAPLPQSAAALGTFGSLPCCVLPLPPRRRNAADPARPDPLLTAAMSRSGDAKELLKGPLIYGLAHTLTALSFWLSCL